METMGDSRHPSMGEGVLADPIMVREERRGTGDFFLL